MLYFTVPTLSTFFGDDQRSNSQKWHPSRLLNDDILAIIWSLKTLTVCSNPPEGALTIYAIKIGGLKFFVSDITWVEGFNSITVFVGS